MTVHVYRNLHRNCWSVRQSGKVIDHVDKLTLANVTGHVQPAGRAKVLRTGVKNVHAYLKGNITDDEVKYHTRHLVIYNPYKYDRFQVKYRKVIVPMTTLPYVHFSSKGFVRVVFA